MAQTFHRYRAGDKPVGGYKLVRKLGEGGFGEVWQASAPGGAEVALKFIDLTGQQGFREFKALRLVKRVRHTNLIPLHGFWLKNEDGTLIDESDTSWSSLAPSVSVDPSSPPPAALATAVFTQPVELIIAMGLGEKSLYDRLRECTSEGLAGIPADELLDFMEDAAKGIDYLNRPIHDMGQGPMPIIHSDVKPHNILIVGDSAAVCDFGLAHAVEALRKTCAAPLTLAYAAPESFRGKPCDKSDQYSLAITYVELRTGSLPFPESLTGYEVMTAHVQGQLDFSRLTPAEIPVIRKATAPLPQDRWRSCREMIVELRKSLRLTPVADSEAVPLWQTPQGPAIPSITDTPDYRGTIPSPSRLSGDTSRPQGITPPEPHPVVQTQKLRATEPHVINKALERPPVPRRPLPTGAKLFIAVVLLIAVGGAVAYSILDRGSKGDISRVNEVKKDDSSSGGSGAGKTVEVDPAQEVIDLFYGRIKEREYVKAAHLLSEQADLVAARDPGKLRDDLQRAWRGFADQRFVDARTTSDLRLVRDQYAGLAKEFPKVADFHLMHGRVLLALGDDQNARAALANITEPYKDQSPRELIFSFLNLELNPRSIEQLDQIGRLSRAAKEQSEQKGGAALPGAEPVWQFTAAESQRIRGTQAQVIDNHVQVALTKSGPSKQLVSDLQKIIQIDDRNPNVWVLKAELHFLLDQEAEAIQAIEKRIGLSDVTLMNGLKDRASALEAWYQLKKGTDEKKLFETLNDVPRLMELKNSQRMLAEAVVSLANRSPKHLAPAVQALRGAAEKPDSEIQPDFARLLATQIRKKIAEAPVTAANAQQLIKDSRFIIEHDQEVDEIARACHAEALLALNQSGALQALGAPSASPSPYYLFVKALALSRDPNAAAEMRKTLDQLFRSKPTPPLRQPDRLAAAFRLLDLEVANIPAPQFSIATALKPPSPDTFLPIHDTLQNAYSWSSSTVPLSERARAHLAIVAYWRQTDANLAARLGAELVSRWRGGADEQLDPSLVYPLYFTYLAAHRNSAEASTQETVLAVADRLMVLSKGKTPDNAQAQALYRIVVEPFDELATTLRSDVFFAHAAEMVAASPNLDWGITGAAGKKLHTSDALDQLYTKAIKLGGGKEPRYHLARGRVRLNHKPFNLQAVLEDAQALSADKESRVDAQLLRGHAYFYKSREEPTNKARLAALDQALKALQGVVNHAGQRESTDDEEAERLLLMSYVHLERRNFQGLGAGAVDDFKTAAKYAEEAREFLKDKQLALAYSAAGNAYEDLAWYTGTDMVSNYKKAVDNFGYAILADPNSALAHMNLGRCYYKMAAVSGVAPPGLGTLQGIIAKAQDALKKATELAQPQGNAEAHYWLAKARQVKHLSERVPVEQAKARLNDADFRAADDELIKAVEIAVRQDLPDSALRVFVVELAESILLHPSFHSRDPVVRKSARVKVNARIDQLKQHHLPRTTGVDMDQEIRLLRARATRLIDSGVPALRELDSVAAELRRTDLDRVSGSDAKLMEFRFSVFDDLRPDERSRETMENWLNDAIWYARLPYTIRRKQAAPILDAARSEAEKLNMFANYERQWLKSAILSSPFDKRVTKWYQDLVVSYELRVKSAAADPNKSAAAMLSAADELEQFADDLESRSRDKEARQLKDQAGKYRAAANKQVGTGARSNARPVSQRKG